MNQSYLRLTCFCALLAAAIAGGCAHSVERERKVGEQASKELVSEVGLYDDARLTAYVNDTGQKVVAQVQDRPFDFEFQILDQPVANALSLPGGHVYVTRGLLALTNSQDELACVLGHETTHVIKRHAAQRMDAATVPAILSLPGALVGTVAPRTGDLLAAPARGVGAVFLAGYSRDQEREADRVGQELAARAGFDPHAMPEFLDRLGQSESLASNPHDRRIPDILQTHPQTPERVAAAQKRADQLAANAPPPPSPNDRDAYVELLDGLIVGDNPAAGLFVGDAFLHPTLGFAFDSPHGWSRLNQPAGVLVISPKQDAAMLLDRESGVTTPDKAAEQFIAELRRQGMREHNAESLTIGGFPARRVALEQADGGTVVHLDVTWLLHRDVTYRLVGIATTSTIKPVLAAVESFHDLTPAERASIKVTRLRIADVRSGERLAEVSRRTGNQWDAKTTAVMNGIDEIAPLRTGQRIKVAATEAYVGTD
jgi:predicted Zn-dependent protease